MTDEQFINIALKNNVSIKQIGNKFYISQAEKMFELQEHYFPIAKMFMKKKFHQNDSLIEALVVVGMNKVSASFTLAQFIVDYSNYID